ncbi:hypothetical protein [Kitasatospora sp. LaBMicrA B282]|uniref:hypothetical protein n=1 Tax=Kitasatospora sp. LaBMicrA B282 TaxID=3420949 RepID=UPI003D131942
MAASSERPRRTRRLAVLLPAGVFAVLPASTATADPDPTPAPLTLVCQTATARIAAGDLTEAKRLLVRVPSPGEDSCVQTLLGQVEQQRSDAADAVLAGQAKLAAGDLKDAGYQFRLAEMLDRSNQDAINGVAQVSRLEDEPLAPAGTNWESFYQDWLLPLGKVALPTLVGIAVLLLAASGATRWVVRPGAVAWEKRERYPLNAMSAVLVFGLSAMLPVYTMFKPFGVHWALAAAAFWLVVFFALMPILLVFVFWCRKHPEARAKQLWKDWWRLGLALTLVLATTIALCWHWSGHPGDQLLVTYPALAVLAVLLVAAGYGQNLRLQVEAQNSDGSVDAAATDYVLTRLLTIGDERRPKDLRVALRQSPVSALQSETLSALPSGAWVSAFAKLYFTLRPDLTWRARVTRVDCNRVTITLTRNGRLAASDLFSREDLGLPKIDDKDTKPAIASAQNQAQAQLLTGAAAFILVQLSQVHRELGEELSGLTNWKSLTLQVIACSRALADNTYDAVPLLAGAVNEDPGYLAARYEYLWAYFRSLPPAERDCGDFATALAAVLLPNNDVEESRLPLSPQLRIKVLYTCAAQWLNGYLNSGQPDKEMLAPAITMAANLVESCEKEKDRQSPHQEYAGHMYPFAKNLEYAAKLLANRATFPRDRRAADPEQERATNPEQNRGVIPADWLHPHPAAPFSPRLAWDQACLDALLWRLSEEQQWSADALQDLRYALYSPELRSQAQDDPCLRPLSDHPTFQRIVGRPIETMIDLALFEPHREQLKAAALATPESLVEATDTQAKCEDLARFLNCSPHQIQRYRDLAELAAIAPELNDRQMLELLATIPVSSARILRAWAAGPESRKRLVNDIRDKAVTLDLTTLPGVVNLARWLDRLPR